MNRSHFVCVFLKSSCLTLALATAFLAGSLAAAEPAQEQSPVDTGLTADPLPDGTQEALRRMATFRVPKGLQIELFAAEPMLGNVVALCLDEQNRVYLAEEYRFNRGTEENRTRPFFLEDDLQLKTVDDRLAMYRKHADRFEGGMEWFSKWTDQVRRLEDQDGDGRAERSTVFATGFNHPLDGLAAGLIARDGDVWFTCIPHLWRLRDTDGDGKAEERESLLYGFGVNAAFLGHDLHGLAWGPDGRLYFSVGDRGFHVRTKEGDVVSDPRRGAVFRCNPDGTGLEVVHRGLRNPQELAFDQFGNLFAADNNCDKGDHSRLVHVVEGGDSGWNMAYQTIEAPYLTGPWHAEQMWHLATDDQPAWILPPIGKLGAGPSGFTFTSGISLPPRYRNSFFLCNYTGNGGVEAFRLRAKGASYEMHDEHDFLKPISATDVDFGYDGKMYVSDFVKLVWNGGSAGGRVYTVFDPEGLKEPAVRQMEELFRTGFKERSIDELAGLLSHPDMRVRLRAQFTLAERGEAAIAAFTRIARSGNDLLPRLHAIWGLGQLGGKHPQVFAELQPLLEDSDPEIRGQVARLLGDHRVRDVAPRLLQLLKDSSPRVRFLACMALGKVGSSDAIPPILELVRSDEGKDRYLRHAAVTALTWIDDREAVQKHAGDESDAVRMVVLLVQRRWQDPRIAQFLNDRELRLVTEAARAIHDLPLAELMPELAGLISRLETTGQSGPDALLRRVIDANFRIGGAEQAEQLARFAASPLHSATMRGEALTALSLWSQPPPRDRVIGYWRPLEKRDGAPARDALERSLPAILASAPAELQTQVAELINDLKLKADEDTFAMWVQDESRTAATRVAALRILGARKSAKFAAALEAGLASDDPGLRAGTLNLLGTTDPDRALPLLESVLADRQAPLRERQAAVATLAAMEHSAADRLLEQWGRKLAKGNVGPALHLDLTEALEARNSEEMAASLAKFRSQQSDSPLGDFTVCRSGGDAESGAAIFRGHRLAQCIRCHKVRDEGGKAGPDLTEIARRHPENLREYVVESLLYPDAKIARGFGSVALVLTSGKVVAGILRAETDQSVTLEIEEGKTIEVPVADIDDRSQPKSAMPSVRKALTKRELRDLVEFLVGPESGHGKPISASGSTTGGR